MRKDRVTVTAGFLIVLAALLYLDRWNLLPPALAACALHELGHTAAILALGGRVGQLRLTAAGAALTPERRSMFSYGEEILIALAGPAVSLSLAALLAWRGAYLFAGMNCAAGLFNLLPVAPLDGGRVLQCALSARQGPDRAERTCARLAVLLGLMLIPLGVYLTVQGGGNFTLLLSAVWLLAGNSRNF